MAIYAFLIFAVNTFICLKISIFKVGTSLLKPSLLALFMLIVCYFSCFCPSKVQVELTQYRTNISWFCFDPSERQEI